MNLSELSIHRPVLATVFVLIIILFGVIGYTSLPVREYPNVDNPIITVTVSYPGANAEVIENQITEPLEQNINGIPEFDHSPARVVRDVRVSLSNLNLV
jgi:multidrug efflux pump